MALKISVFKNHLASCPSPYIVRSENSETVEFDKLVNLMATGRTTLTKTDILAALQLFKEELQRQLAEGRTVKTPTGAFYLCAAGSLESLDESFLPGCQDNNHEVRLHHRPEKSFEDGLLAQLEIVRGERIDLSSPSIKAVLPAGSDAAAGIHSGGMAQIKGLRLRFDSSLADQGVFFIDSKGTRTRSPFYPMIMPGTVLAAVPEGLEPGAYSVALRAAVNGKDVREDRVESVALGSP
jgi:hypothetical protein